MTIVTGEGKDRKVYETFGYAGDREAARRDAEAGKIGARGTYPCLVLVFEGEERPELADDDENEGSDFCRNCGAHVDEFCDCWE